MKDLRDLEELNIMLSIEELVKLTALVEGQPPEAFPKLTNPLLEALESN